MPAVARWINWQVEKLLPDPRQSFQRFELDRALLEELDWLPHEHVLDVGCFDGQYCRALADQVACVVGLDLDAAALRRLDDPRVGRIQADGQRLPFGDASFDTVLCHQTTFLFPDPASAAAEFARCCRPGGRVVISVSNLAAPYQRANALLNRIRLPRAWRTAPRPGNDWDAPRWRAVFAALGLSLDAVYSCNLCWPLVHRVAGRWIIPNRAMHPWNQAVRRISRLPLRTAALHWAANDYLLCFRKAERP